MRKQEAIDLDAGRIRLADLDSDDEYTGGRRGRKKKDSPTKLKVNPRENKTTAGEIKKNDIVGLTNVSGKSLVAQTVVVNHDLIEESKSKRDILKEEAAEKREIRRIKRLKQQSALLIQKTYRSSKVRKNTIKTASNVLSRKWKDQILKLLLEPVNLNRYTPMFNNMVLAL